MKDVEAKVESHTQALRDLLKIIPSDGPPTHGVDGKTMRAEAKETFTEVAGLLKALQKDIDDLTGQLDQKSEELEDARGDTKRLEELIDMVRDVDRRVIGGRELINYVKENYPL